jgi:hypothetical protein
MQVVLSRIQTKILYRYYLFSNLLWNQTNIPDCYKKGEGVCCDNLEIFNVLESLFCELIINKRLRHVSGRVAFGWN